MPSAHLIARFSSLSGRYAKALYGQIKDSERLQVLEQLVLVLECLHQVKPLKKILYNEYAGVEDVKNIINRLCDVINLNGKVRNLLFLLQSNRRFKFLPDIIKIYRKIYESSHEASSVLVTFSHEPEETLKEKIISKLKKVFGNNIQTTYLIDPTIFGGMIVQNDQYIVDLSVASQLQSMRRSLKG